MPHPWLRSLQSCPIIAIVRSLRRDWGYQMAVTAIEAGLSCIEIAWGEEGVTLDLIHTLRAAYPHCSIGVGTILQVSQLDKAIAAGSQFAFSPILDLKLLALAQGQNFPFIPGTLTPTEIWTAWQQGAIAVKVFPVQALGGSHYLNSLRGALGEIPLIPTGGVNVENAIPLLRSGATALGISSSLFPKLQSGEPDLPQTQRVIETLLQNYRDAHS